MGIRGISAEEQFSPAGDGRAADCPMAGTAGEQVDVLLQPKRACGEIRRPPSRSVPMFLGAIRLQAGHNSSTAYPRLNTALRGPLDAREESSSLTLLPPSTLAILVRRRERGNWWRSDVRRALEGDLAS